VTIPRPVHVKSRTRIGKEITVDPTDSDKDFTAEMLNATDVVEYRNPEEKLDGLRAAVRAAGIKRIARLSGLQRSKVQAFVNQGATPHPSSIAKIEAAL
jgi:DNA-binding phage protein